MATETRLTHQGPAAGGWDRRGFLKAAAAGLGALCAGACLFSAGRAYAHGPRKGLVFPRRSPWFTPLPDRHIRCELCPHRCRIAPGARGICRVRENRGGEAYTLAYGNPCLVQLDPVERKPFFHVLPGSRALSVSTAGCPLACAFCEAWDMALATPEELHAYDLPPEEIVAHARAAGARAVSYAFGEPVAFYEYMAQIAVRARQAGLLNLMHTSGFIAREPLEALCGLLDAVNVDLKSIDPDFYRRLCGAELAPVLETLQRLKAAGVHIEITHLLIPTLNDDMERLREMCLWIKRELGPGVPVHFSRFYPLFKLANLPPTPVSTLDRARAVAREVGLDYVYVSRVTGHEGENTFCAGCGGRIIGRMGFVVEAVELNGGACGRCGTPIPGLWA